MFRCIDIPWIIQFFFMFYNDKPVDWLLDGLIQTKVCNLEKDNVSAKLIANCIRCEKKLVYYLVYPKRVTHEPIST